MILFDIDDTLFNNTGAEIRAAQRFYRKTPGLEHFAGQDDFVNLWRAATETYLQKFIDGELTFQEQRRLRLRDIFGRHINAEEADALFERYLGYYEDSWELFPDVIHCLDRLAPLGLGIISNGNSGQQLQKLRDLGILARFDTVVVSEDIGIAKPDPRIFIHACRQASQKASVCCYVGNKLETDAQAAASAGLAGIWLNRNGSRSRQSSIREITTLDALQRNPLKGW